MKKTLSFAVVHFMVVFLLGYLLTGNILVGGTLALVEPALNTVAYHWHERAWKRWGGESRPGPPDRGTVPLAAGPQARMGKAFPQLPR